MESNSLSVRTYRPGDEQAIQAVFETVFGRKRSLAEWRWRFQSPPSGPGMLHVLENEDGIVGHIAHIAFPTWVDGQRLVAGQGGDTMMLPACRGKGGMRQLVDASLAEHTYDLRLNFPSDMARPLFVRYGAGVVVEALPSWVRRNSLTRPLPAFAAPLARAGDGRLTGISVLGLEAGAHGRTGWINDLLAPDRATLRALLVDAVARLVAQGAGSVRCHYLDPRPWARRVFMRSGFLPSGEEHPFIVRALSPAAGDGPEQPGSWYLTRSDTEPWPSLTEI